MENNSTKHCWQVTNIVYDTDGEIVIGLPESVSVFCEEEDIADVISDHTGWCVDSFEYEQQKDPWNTTGITK